MADLIAQVIGLGAAAISGGGVTAFFGYLTNRGHEKTVAQEAVDRAIKTALDSTTSEIERLNGEIEKMKASHRAEMTMMAEDRARDRAACEDEQHRLRAQIAELMRQYGIASYKPADLKRVLK